MAWQSSRPCLGTQLRPSLYCRPVFERPCPLTLPRRLLIPLLPLPLEAAQAEDEASVLPSERQRSPIYYLLGKIQGKRRGKWGGFSGKEGVGWRKGRT